MSSMISRLLHTPETMSALGFVGAILTGWSAKGSPWAGALFATLSGTAVARAWYLWRRRHQFVMRLRSASESLGEADFVRPVDESAGAALDALAAALASHHTRLWKWRRETWQQRRAFDALFNASPGPSLLVSKDGKVQEVNPVVCETFHIGRDEALGRPFLQVIRSHTIDRAVRSALSNGERATLEVDVRIAQAPIQYWVQIEPITMEGSDQVDGAVVLLHDVTQLRHLEHVRKEFVANVSHELRTPITSIKGFVETLLDQELPDSTRKRFLNILKTEADRLYALVSDLLDLSLLESNTGPTPKELVDIPRLAAGVFELLQPQASKKQIRTLYTGPDDLPPLPANPEMIEQAFVDLVDNAIKYSPEGSTVSIEARRVATEYVEIALVDNGPGIPSEHLSRLFERFYRVDKARSKSMGGTGLGLAIVKHIVQRHGGTIRAESRLGRGSRFIITLPLTEEEDDAPVPRWVD